MIKRKNILKIAIDSPAAAGAGTLAKAISKHYNLFYLDTGKIYRFIAYLKIKYPKKFNNKFIKSKIKLLKIKDLSDNNLLSDEVNLVYVLKRIGLRIKPSENNTFDIKEILDPSGISTNTEDSLVTLKWINVKENTIKNINVRKINLKFFT